MNYQNINNEISNLNFQRKYFLSIFGLYLFALGTTILGYSIYLLLESLGLVDRAVTTWNAQGLFWFLILFCLALFILFVPVEFLNVFKLYNSTFKDLIVNIILVILTSLLSLIFFQFLLNPSVIPLPANTTFSPEASSLASYILSMSVIPISLRRFIFPSFV